MNNYLNAYFLNIKLCTSGIQYDKIIQPQNKSFLCMILVTSNK